MGGAERPRGSWSKERWAAHSVFTQVLALQPRINGERQKGKKAIAAIYRVKIQTYESPSCPVSVLLVQKEVTRSTAPSAI